jgi:hypothetical protein
LLAALNVLLPLSVAHAVVRHRVLDVDFVISRTIVYTGFTAALVGAFAFLDWIFGNILEDFRLSLIVNAGVSVGVAFAFDALQGRVAQTIEALLFRKRHLALAQLEKLARDLRHVRSPEVVERTVVIDVSTTLELASVALFLYRDGAFARISSTGWNPENCTRIAAGDALAAALRKNDAFVRLDAIRWRQEDLPGGTHAPLIAVPIAYRFELQGIVFYGGHIDGSDVDSAELQLLERLVDAAAVALDDIDAESMRAQIEELEKNRPALPDLTA